MFNTHLSEIAQSLLLNHELGVDLEERIVYMFGEMGGDDGNDSAAITNLRFLTSMKRFPLTYQDPIRLVIDSPGGSEISMLHLYDVITTSPAPIWTVGVGEVCSAATLILVAGDRRFATENAFFMTHKGKMGIEGDEDEIAAQAALHKKVSDRYWRLMERHTKLTAKEWFSKSKNKGELWLGVDKLLKYGVIDEVIPTIKNWPPLSTDPVRTKRKNDEEDEGDE
jgi:ATP-dependent Clp protease protease subunit